MSNRVSLKASLRVHSPQVVGVYDLCPLNAYRAVLDVLGRSGAPTKRIWIALLATNCRVERKARDKPADAAGKLMMFALATTSGKGEHCVTGCRHVGADQAGYV